MPTARTLVRELRELGPGAAVLRALSEAERRTARRSAYPPPGGSYGKPWDR